MQPALQPAAAVPVPQPQEDDRVAMAYPYRGPRNQHALYRADYRQRGSPRPRLQLQAERDESDQSGREIGVLRGHSDDGLRLINSSPATQPADDGQIVLPFGDLGPKETKSVQLTVGPSDWGISPGAMPSATSRRPSALPSTSSTPRFTLSPKARQRPTSARKSFRNTR